RLHGSSSYRVPWLFDDESCDVARKFAKLKCALMPYLYGAAVEAHTRGTPMLRPMMLEFPDDPGCDMLDRQYMLGERLLVAPVFSESGVVDYYLPAGRWTNLLSGKTIEGGGWRRETHGYLSLPLMVRPNTVLPIGNVDSRPDYDYARGLTLHLFEIEDGAQIDVAVPDTRGRTAVTFRVAREGCVICVDSDAADAYEVLLHGIRGARCAAGQAVADEAGARFRLPGGRAEIAL
ncbi:MAG: alpha-xylosidase, partial [Clostridiales bacterium]|nr:alpha-xylosidase [Clostridiales bacterium]